MYLRTMKIGNGIFIEPNRFLALLDGVGATKGKTTAHDIHFREEKGNLRSQRIADGFMRPSPIGGSRLWR
jgi:hypothetical protein